MCARIKGRPKIASTLPPRSLHEPLHNRHAPSHAEGLGSDADSGGGLLAFPLVQIHASLDPADHGFIEAARGDFLRTQVLLDVKLKDRVEDVVFRGNGVSVQILTKRNGKWGQMRR